MPLGMEVALGPNDIVLDGDPAHPHQKRGTAPSFWPCLLWPNGWMDQDITWYGGSLGTRDVLHWDPAPDGKGHSAPPHVFGACLLWPYGRPSQQLLSSCFVSI